MIPNLKIMQMGADKNSEVHVFKFKQSTWTTLVKGSYDGTAFEVSGNGDTLSEAVDECHRRWERIAGAMPELIGALPPPDPSTYQDADHMVSPDDNIPF